MKSTRNSVVIIGSGIAGLYAALKIAENSDKDILLITKSALKESNSRYAQGGIAGVLPENNIDSINLHVQDTIRAGAGLTDENVAKFISENSADVIKSLINYGVEFDRDKNEKVALTLEAAHSVKRILHAGGDSTGKSIEWALSDLVESNPNINIYQKAQAVDLLIDSKGICRGVIVFHAETGEYEAIFSPAVIIATGGIGQVYSNTTNPKIATGDGIALAYRANAAIQDMEFIQFHPTALAINGNETRFLISESVRGEGAKLKNLNGELFTCKYDKMGDLAPRDVVTRAIFFEMSETNTSHVLLDTSSIKKESLKERFPNIIRVCKESGLDILSKPIPVSPAAHYAMGGIKISLDGKTSISGLYAIGEASCSGLHGANRLASNSLLECVVISSELAKCLNNKSLDDTTGEDSTISLLIEKYDKSCNFSGKDIAIFSKELKYLMWDNAGIIRNQEKLSFALSEIAEMKSEFNSDKCASIEEYEFRNLLIISDLIVKSAIARKESRGAHYREDYPGTDKNAYHSVIKKGELMPCYAIL